MSKPTGKERALRDQIRQQEEKILRIQASIKETQRALDEYLASLTPPLPPFAMAPKDDHDYCGKILYASEKAAHAARKLINRDLVKNNKPPMKRAYFCKRCEAWHLTTIEKWMPFPENEINSQKLVQ
jgi:hypothetical protein